MRLLWLTTAVVTNIILRFIRCTKPLYQLEIHLHSSTYRLPELVIKNISLMCMADGLLSLAKLEDVLGMKQGRDSWLNKHNMTVNAKMLKLHCLTRSHVKPYSL